MELYILDSLNRRVEVVDRFLSLVWAERWQGWGDVELVLHSTKENRTLFTTDTKLALNESYRTMMIETVIDTTDEEGRETLTVKGRSWEKILDDRVARPSMADLEEVPKWVLTGLPAALARKVFRDVCVFGLLNPHDVIDGIIEDSLFPDETIPEPTASVTVSLDPMSVYEGLQQIGETYDLGFRLVRNVITGQMHFDIYTGNDRTSGQSILSPVIFSPSLDNLKNTTELSSVENYKNCALVVSKVNAAFVYADGVDSSIENFARRVLLVKADDIDDPVGYPGLMAQRGKEELAKHRALQAFDGEVVNPYKYGVDYQLGDLVEMRNIDGITNNMRVTEQIFISDAEGERSYPTLVTKQFIMPGTWLAWDYNQVWSEVDPALDWEDA